MSLWGAWGKMMDCTLRAAAKSLPPPPLFAFQCC